MYIMHLLRHGGLGCAVVCTAIYINIEYSWISRYDLLMLLLWWRKVLVAWTEG